MKKFAYTSVKEETVPKPAEGVKVRWLITDKTGAPNFSMRHFTVSPGGSTPKHDHPWEHEAFILEGTATVYGENEMQELREGDVIFIPPHELHQFQNTGDVELKFLCMIPNQENLDR